MKKFTALTLVLILLLSIVPLSAFAATPRTAMIYPTLSFSGTTATCSLIVTADPGDNISAVVKLWRGGSCLATWNASGTRTLSFSRTATVSKSQTYTLTADVTINGVSQPQASTTRSN